MARTWSASTPGSSSTSSVSCASAAAASPCCPAPPAPSRCWRWSPTSSFSPMAPATQVPSTTSSTPCATSSGASRSSASASATSCFAVRLASRPSSCPSAIVVPTTRTRSWQADGSRSPRRITASPCGDRMASRGSRSTSRSAGRPTSASPSSPTSISTTARWRAWCSRTSPLRPSSTTPRPAPARTMPAISSTASWSSHMPRRTDIEKILLIGSGPIVIGQAAEFDYSGVQACKVLLEEGYEVVLVNSNPATIMTDPEFATRTYIEPLLPGPVTKVIEREKPDALLPTLGGGTALNLARQLTERGVLEQHGVELLGANYDVIRRAEDRDLFKATMEKAGLRVPKAAAVESMAEALKPLPHIGMPAIVRPGFTMGGHGGGIAYTEAEYHERVTEGLAASPINQVLVEESVIGWGEFELELMRDRNDNVVIVCSIENVDPMGVHTGDSVTVAPQQTLTDKQYQKLRDQAITVIRAVGVETGGSNIQFAVNPHTDEIVVIEMNPRVSRSSALASKATGFPIAKIAARLAVGYALEEIPNDITKATPASFEPTIDYVVVKWPRFAFEKFPGAEPHLTTSMKSVGEAMAIGRTFKQAFFKAMRSRELDVIPKPPDDTEEILTRLETPSSDRYELIAAAVERGVSEAEICKRSLIDPWFVAQI